MMFPLNLFRLGDGNPPPHLAGREREMDALAPMAADMREKRSPSADVILYGPRGNGKTVLLDVIGGRLRQAGAAVVQATAKGKAASKEALAGALAPNDDWRGALHRLSGRTGVSPSRLSLFGVGLDLDRPGGPSAKQMLAARCAERPLALLVDEAHALDANLGGQLLDASQSIRRNGAPFLLVLAGTPEVQQVLQKMNTSHWERARRVPVGRLDPGEDREALMKPLEDLGGPAEEDALARLLEAAHRYPYFLQEVGSATVAALNRNRARRIDAVAGHALSSFEPVRNAFYDGRVDELDDAGLLPQAIAVARAFGGTDWIRRPALVEALAAGDGRNGSGPDVRQARRGLVARGWSGQRTAVTSPAFPPFWRIWWRCHAHRRRGMQVPGTGRRRRDRAVADTVHVAAVVCRTAFRTDTAQRHQELAGAGTAVADHRVRQRRRRGGRRPGVFAAPRARRGVRRTRGADTVCDARARRACRQARNCCASSTRTASFWTVSATRWSALPRTRTRA